MKKTIRPNGEPIWQDSVGRVDVRFIGRRSDDRSLPVAEAIQEVEQADRSENPVAWCRQVHSDRVLHARGPGSVGEGDALWSAEDDLCLAVVTADCVPVLLATPNRVAAVHAGWRGIVSEIVPQAIAALEAGEPRRSEDPGARALQAWIGPAIGPCCYEVNFEVADAVTAVTNNSIQTMGPRDKPHLDLQAAVAHQLRACGIETISRVSDCTRCSSDALWSYRRDGPGGGRNLSWIRRRR